MKELKIGEVIKYSADELYKTQPKEIDGLRLEDTGEGVYSIKVNGVNIFASRYEVSYSGGSVYIDFYNEKNKIVAVTGVHGSNEYKKDESFYVAYGEIISESEIRVINSNILCK